MLSNLHCQCRISVHFGWLIVAASTAHTFGADEAELIVHGGKVFTAARDGAVHEALAAREGRLLKVGSNAEVLALGGPQTRVIDLGGKLVLPGLIDSHVHPTGASLTEFDHPIPPMETIADVLAYIRARAAAVGPGEWIVLRQIFITRLREQRYPTKAEMDEAAPLNPVAYSTGPDASVNSLAMRLSGIDKDFQPTAGGKIERDAATGEPTGILRNATAYLKIKTNERQPTEAQRDARLKQLLADYNSVGITGIIDRDCTADNLTQYARLRAAGDLSVRVAVSHDVSNKLPVDQMREKIREIAAHPLRQPDSQLRIVGIKTFLDGGMLTGSAYMLEPWGLSTIYSIDDPRYRGMLYLPPETLVPMVRATVEAGLQFTAHSVGDGAVQALLDAYEEVDKTTPVAPTRPCLTHSNFMSAKSIFRAARLGVVLDVQPAWLWLDTRTLLAQFGYDRLRYFQPLRTIFESKVIAGGGSDHMQRIGALRAVNPYDPLLGMWVTITRRAKGVDQPLHPEEALTRQQAIRFYTANNAYLMFLEDQIGTLEAGKLADFIILDRDLLSCPENEIRDARPLQTYLGAKLVYDRTQAGETH
jgi:predicted amidohydrolase YtcJ